MGKEKSPLDIPTHFIDTLTSQILRTLFSIFHSDSNFPYMIHWAELKREICRKTYVKRIIFFILIVDKSKSMTPVHSAYSYKKKTSHQRWAAIRFSDLNCQVDFINLFFDYTDMMLQLTENRITALHWKSFGSCTVNHISVFFDRISNVTKNKTL